MQEYHTWLFSDDNTMENAIWVKEWSPERTRPSIKFGKRIRSAQDIKKWMEEAGFLDVHEEIYKVRMPAFGQYLSSPLTGHPGASRDVAQGQEFKTAGQILPRGAFGCVRAISSRVIHTHSRLQDRGIAGINGGFETQVL
jgi:hypothetical protein